MTKQVWIGHELTEKIVNLNKLSRILQNKGCWPSNRSSQKRSQKRSQFFVTFSVKISTVFLHKKRHLCNLDNWHWPTFPFFLSGWQPVVHNYRTQGEEKRKFSGSLWCWRFWQKSLPLKVLKVIITILSIYKELPLKTFCPLLLLLNCFSKLPKNKKKIWYYFVT